MIKVDNWKFSFLGGLLAVSLSIWVACNNNSNTNTSNNNTTAEQPTSVDETTNYPAGKIIYQKTCITCHGTQGDGAVGTYPPLAKSDFLLADKNRAIHQVIMGSSAKYTVNGNSYEGVMPPQGLSDEEVANVLNYVYHAWGNNGFTLTSGDVKAVRDTIKK